MASPSQANSEVPASWLSDVDDCAFKKVCIPVFRKQHEKERIPESLSSEHGAARPAVAALVAVGFCFVPC
jgi:hypothetical protein